MLVGSGGGVDDSGAELEGSWGGGLELLRFLGVLAVEVAVGVVDAVRGGVEGKEMGTSGGVVGRAEMAIGAGRTGGGS